MDILSDSILKVIEELSYNVFIVQQDKRVDCTCVSFDTKQADPACPRCLGTGHKIRIRKIRAASQQSTLPTTMRPTNEIMMAKNYYVKMAYPIEEDNIIVDGDEVHFIYKVRINRSFDGKKSYQKGLGVMKKLDSKVFLKNFNAIVGG